MDFKQKFYRFQIIFRPVSRLLYEVRRFCRGKNLGVRRTQSTCTKPYCMIHHFICLGNSFILSINDLYFCRSQGNQHFFAQNECLSTVLFTFITVNKIGQAINIFSFIAIKIIRKIYISLQRYFINKFEKEFEQFFRSHQYHIEYGTGTFSHM